MPRFGDEVRLGVEAVHEAQMKTTPARGRTGAASAETRRINPTPTDAVPGTSDQPALNRKRAFPRSRKGQSFRL
jgi:hypothetical protein